MVRRMATEFNKRLPKKKFLIFCNEVEKGLIFSEGEEWKKSRSIISNLFHF